MNEFNLLELIATPLQTPRLRLRIVEPGDGPPLEKIINDREIASNTNSIPYPYPAGGLQSWIEEHRELARTGEALSLAVLPRDPAAGPPRGIMGLAIDRESRTAELGYWLGREYWGQGLATEAAQAVLQCGFESLGLLRIHAHHLTRNPASGRVLEKAGMLQEGVLRQHAFKWGVLEDVAWYGMLASDRRPWDAGVGQNA